MDIVEGVHSKKKAITHTSKASKTAPFFYVQHAYEKPSQHKLYIIVMETVEIIGSLYGSPGDALKLLQESAHLKSIALKDVDEEVVSIASVALGRMIDEEVSEASKLSYTAGPRPSVSIYNNDGDIKLSFDVVECSDETAVVLVETGTIIDAVEAYGSQRNKDIALHPLAQANGIYGYIKIRIPMSDALQALCKAAAWHYSVPVLLNDIPGKLAQ